MKAGVKSFCWWAAGFAAAAAGLIVWGPKLKRPVEELATQLEEHWPDGRGLG